MIINNINNFVLFFDVLKKYTRANPIPKNDFVFQIYNKMKFPQTFSVLEMLELGEQLQLIIIHTNKIWLSDIGKHVAEMGTKSQDLNKRQLEYIVINGFFENPIFVNLFNYLQNIKHNEQRDLWILKDDISTEFRDHPIELLSQMEIIQETPLGWAINPKYVKRVKTHNAGIMGTIENKTTQEELNRILLERRKIGELAEEITVKYEKRRLRKSGHIRESHRVKRISRENVSRGYDIESFSGKVSSTTPNLFIEVKGSKSNRMLFVITSNELRMARMLKSKYSIYFWNRLGINENPQKPKLIINNPYKKLNIQECENCMSYSVNMQGWND